MNPRTERITFLTSQIATLDDLLRDIPPDDVLERPGLEHRRRECLIKLAQMAAEPPVNPPDIPTAAVIPAAAGALFIAIQAGPYLTAIGFCLVLWGDGFLLQYLSRHYQPRLAIRVVIFTIISLIGLLRATLALLSN